jgi:predicted  nucleic acid-binding Zn-ribbon protein
MAQPHQEDDLEKKLDELGSLIGKMTQQNEALQQKIQKNSEFNASVKIRVSGIKSKVDMLKSNLEKFKLKYDESQNNIATLNGHIKDLQNQIEELNKIPVSSDDKQQIKELTEQVAILNKQITAAKGIVTNYSEKIKNIINEYNDLVSKIPSDDVALNTSLSEMEEIINSLLQKFPDTDTSSGTNNDVGAINNDVGAISATTPGANDNQNVEPIVPPVPITKENTLKLAYSIKNSAKYNNMSNNVKSEIQVYINQLQGNNKNVDVNAINKRLTQIVSNKGGRKTHKRRRRKTHKKQKGGWKYNKGWKYSNRTKHTRSSKSRRTRSSK